MRESILRLTAPLVIFILLTGTVVSPKPVRADLFGVDVIVLGKILIETINQVAKLGDILGKASQTVSILEEMNRGVKEVLRLAETAHVPIPPGVYEKAKKFDQAVWEAKALYGEMPDRAPTYTRSNRQSAVEALSLSQDAVDYSTFLDDKGEKVKSSAILASPGAAARLTAETLGVLLHAESHSNRIQAKVLELSSSSRLEEIAKDNARFESYVNTHKKFEDDLRQSSFSSLNPVGR